MSSPVIISVERAEEEVFPAPELLLVLREGRLVSVTLLSRQGEFLWVVTGMSRVERQFVAALLLSQPALLEQHPPTVV